MADKKITQLTNITGANLVDADEFVVVDISADETKAITLGELKEAFDSGSGFVRITGDTMTGNLDVQGTVTADGLDISTLSGDATVYLQNAASARGMKITKNYDDFSANVFYSLHPTAEAGSLAFKGSQDSTQLFINSNGDISFYEDTGTTPKFFWDASAESLGIGTSSPSTVIDARQSSTGGSTQIRVYNTDNSNTTTQTAGLFLSPDSRANGALIFAEKENADFSTSAGRDISLVFSPVLNNSQTERMRIDSSGNVGIGTSSPSERLEVARTDSDNAIARFSTNNATADIFLESSEGQIRLRKPSGAEFAILNNSNTERMRIDSSGNLLVGKTTGALNTAGLELANTGYISASIDGDVAGYFNRKTSDGDIVQFYKDGTTVGSIDTHGGVIQFGQGNVNLAFENGADVIYPANDNGTNNNGDIDLGTSTARFKDLYLSGGVIQSDGGESVFGGGSPVDSLVAVSIQGASSADAAEVKVRTNGKNAFKFRNSSNSDVGSITVNASSTAYNTSSDYRLKTDAQPMTGATDRLKQLNPVNFEWIAEGTRVDGFLAHEAQAIVPEAVTGTKDAMRDEEYEVTPAVLDDDGNVVTEAVIGTRSVPDYQGIDQSKLVPLLTAALQEALTKIDALEARITALEG